MFKAMNITVKADTYGYAYVKLADEMNGAGLERDQIVNMDIRTCVQDNFGVVLESHIIYEEDK